MRLRLNFNLNYTGRWISWEREFLGERDVVAPFITMAVNRVITRNLDEAEWSAHTDECRRHYMVDIIGRWESGCAPLSLAAPEYSRFTAVGVRTIYSQIHTSSFRLVTTNNNQIWVPED